MEDHAVPGHWEGDLLTAHGRSRRDVMERHTHLAMLVRSGKDAAAVVPAFVGGLVDFPLPCGAR